MNRKTILEYVKKTYQSTPEYLWASSPDSAVLRHSDNRKWYAILMNVSRTKLGLDGTENVDILDLKCDPEQISFLRMTKGICAGYHMNKEHWISVLLDGSVEESLIYQLLAQSFDLTK